MLAIVIISYLAVSQNIYYGYFFSVFLIVSITLCALIKQYKKAIICSILCGVALITSVGIDIAPNYIAIQQSKMDQPEKVGKRYPIESLIYSLQTNIMVTPPANHRSEYFKKISNQVSKSFEYSNENVSTRLGIILSFSMIFLILSPISLQSNKSMQNEQKYLYLTCSTLLIFGIIYGTYGGLHFLVSSLVTPNIRCTNRIFVYLLFFCVLGLAIFLSQYLKKPSINKYFKYSSIIALFIFGLWDTIPVVNSELIHQCIKAYRADKKYFSNLEMQLPPGATIYQYPPQVYPEGGIVNHISSYDPLKALLTTKNLRWSYGYGAGTAGDYFASVVAKASTKRKVEILNSIGFNAILIDKNGFEDCITLADKLPNYATPINLQHINSRYAAFLLHADNKLLPAFPYHLGDEILFGSDGESELYKTHGWYGLENTGSWSSHSAGLAFYCSEEELSRLGTSRVQIHIDCLPYVNSVNNFVVLDIALNSHSLYHKKIGAGQRMLTIEAAPPFLVVGKNSLTFHIDNTSSPKIEGSTDVRELGIFVQKVTLSKEGRMN
jgi:hypothetical protein